MLTDHDLERLLATAAVPATPPVAGPPALDLRPSAAGRRPSFPRWLAPAAAVAVALLIGRDALDDERPAADRAVAIAEAPEGVVGEPVSAPAAGSAGAAAGVGGGAAGLGATTQPVGDGTRIIHEGSIEIEVEEGTFGAAVDRVTAATRGLGGEVTSTQTTELGDAPRGTVTVRVPAERFDALLSELRALGSVRSVTTSAVDVTAQSVDVDARIRALTAARDQLLTVLTEATAVPDILAVQDRLAFNQAELESLEAQQRLLEERSDFGTLAVTVVEPGADEPVTARAADDDGGLSGAWDEARRGFGDAVEWLVARSGKAVVLSIAALAVYAVAAVALRRLRRAAI